MLPGLSTSAFSCQRLLTQVNLTPTSRPRKGAIERSAKRNATSHQVLDCTRTTKYLEGQLTATAIGSWTTMESFLNPDWG